MWRRTIMVIKEQNKKSKVWFVVACEEEFYMPDVNIVYTGVGKVRATMATQHIIDKYQPEKIINIGTAGCISESLCFNVFRIGKIVERDYDTKDGKINEIVLDGNVVLGTGDSFVEDWTGLNFSLVDMEGYAVGYVCKENNIKFECYKYASDTGNMESWEKSLEGCNKTFVDLIKSSKIG